MALDTLKTERTTFVRDEILYNVREIFHFWWNKFFCIIPINSANNIEVYTESEKWGKPMCPLDAKLHAEQY